jgi:hypothetical protein
MSADGSEGGLIAYSADEDTWSAAASTGGLATAVFGVAFKEEFSKLITAHLCII